MSYVPVDTSHCCYLSADSEMFHKSRVSLFTFFSATQMCAAVSFSVIATTAEVGCHETLLMP